MPTRLQLSRQRGHRLPEEAVNVARPGRWGNPHRVDTVGREAAIAAFERDLLAGRLAVTVASVRAHLRGKDLACWCRLDVACHADVLLRIANDDP